jgi:outer membrane lipoprotein SlyB
MNTPHKSGLAMAMAVAAALALGGCADTNNTAYPSSPEVAYAQYGEVQAIELVPHNSMGMGTIAGAVIGGIVGNQVGGGDGKTAATVLGAAGGAYAGHSLEKRNQPQSSAYKISIRMRDGTYQTVTQSDSGNIRVGDRVQVANGVARRL